MSGFKIIFRSVLILNNEIYENGQLCKEIFRLLFDFFKQLCATILS